MFLSRWKMMAGVLGVSLGGLAAMAGQCTKNDPAKGPPPPEMPVASAPATQPPMTPPAPAVEPTKPSSLPAVPVIPAGGVEVPAVPSSGPVSPPDLPMSTPPAPPAPMRDSAPTPPTNPAPASPYAPPSDPPSIDPPPTSVSPAPPRNTGETLPPLDFPKTRPMTAPVATTTAPAAPAASAVQSKYRIVLRVGEGEPVFEVRSGDDLLLKVVCEKVDVKSPEKGQGLSAVKACGKVRFAGFGAEGTCDELQFLAGTGEVAMTGHVRIQVKDKLGRVESELTADTMKYRIDPNAVTGNGQLKP